MCDYYRHRPNHIHGIITIVGAPLVGTQKNHRRFTKTGRHNACPGMTLGRGPAPAAVKWVSENLR